MKEYQRCKGCGELIKEYEDIEHHKKCFPKDYEGILSTGYKLKGE